MNIQIHDHDYFLKKLMLYVIKQIETTLPSQWVSGNNATDPMLIQRQGKVFLNADRRSLINAIVAHYIDSKNITFEDYSGDSGQAIALDYFKRQARNKLNKHPEFLRVKAEFRQRLNQERK
jgi:hypothetical protein